MGIKRESGVRRKFSTGAEKQHAVGKGTPVLVPGDAIRDVSKHFEEGAVLHGDRNWEKGIPLSELLNSLERHLQDEKMSMTDENHARALAWNAIVYLATKLRIESGLLPAELGDIPKYEQQKSKYPEPLINKLCSECEKRISEANDGDCVPICDMCAGVEKIKRPSIECIPEKGWQISLGGGKFLMVYPDECVKSGMNFQEVSSPCYHATKRKAEYCLNLYLKGNKS